MPSALSTKSFTVGHKFSVPIDAVTQKMAHLGRTGSGKTYAAGVMAEKMIELGAQVVILDPVGVWYGICLLKNGKPHNWPIYVFGGLHGHIPLESTGGAIAADFIVDTHSSVILDVSQFESDTQKARFAAEFADRFFFRKKASPSAVHIFMEECQEFIPQNPMKGEERMLHAFTRLWKLGRNFGIGGSLISQRPQEVNKKALNMTECLFAFQMTGPHERKTIESWVAEKGLDIDIVGTLPKLKVGQCQAWSPQWLGINRTVQWNEKITFDASRTPTAMSGPAKTVKLAPVDLSKLSKAMQATVEKAKQNDPEALRRKIRELEMALQKSSTSTKTPNDTAIQKERERCQAHLHKSMETRINMLQSSIEDYRRAISKAVEILATKVTTKLPARREIAWIDKITPPESKRKEEISIPKKSLFSEKQLKQILNSPESNGYLPKGEKAILKAAAQFGEEAGVERNTLTVLTGYKRSSRDAFISRLIGKGLLASGNRGLVATHEGRVALGPDFEMLPTGQDLLEYWMQRLPQGERAVLEVLVAANGQPVDRDSICENTPYKRSSRDAFISRLSARRLVEQAGKGQICASKMLFD